MLRKKLIAAGAGAALSIAAVVVSHFEGLEKAAYKDPIGIPTICYGHTATAELGQVKTEAECDGLLKEDLQVALDAVDKYVKVEMPAQRRAAFVSFVYNVGAGNFARSTMLRKLNAGDSRGACAELDKWVYAGGRVLPGLVKRRAEERALCEVGL
ncbi:lysozyme [Stutzerimonas kunmingensis]|uniref:Lysozyme n=1 Tax=Stutzerimonas kunmingensis TaxID=1211807 RepID=A0A9X1N465_9GAMM|nr:lysozyme [Stutzerimonas kunmingensis]MCD1608623.1 lysozyme [Stutzerimonas kunmingensis]